MSAPTTLRLAQTAPPGPPEIRSHATASDRDTALKAIGKLNQINALLTKALLTLGGGALIFTCVNVTRFAMTHDIPWYVAWMLDPLASLALVTVLYVDGVLAQQGNYKPSGWPFLLRWTAGLSTWVMNCWTSLFPDGHFHLVPQKPDAGGILLHSIAPVLLILLSEAASGYRRHVTKNLALHQTIVDAFDRSQKAEKERERDEKNARDREQREEHNAREREARERQREIEERELARQENEERRKAEREERDHNARLERERLAAENEAAERSKRTEIEVEREKVRLAREAAEIEDARRDREAGIEAQRKRTQAELEQQERDREAARQAEIIKAEAEAQALRTTAEAKAQALRVQAEAEAKAREEAERIKRERAVERAAARTRTTSESAHRHASISAARTSESGTALTAVPALTASESEGRVPREVRAQQRDQAERYVAKCMLDGLTPDLEGLAKQYDKGETWVGDRVRDAKRRLAEEPGFEDAVIADALEAFTTDDSDEAAGAA